MYMMDMLSLVEFIFDKKQFAYIVVILLRMMKKIITFVTSSLRPPI